MSDSTRMPPSPAAPTPPQPKNGLGTAGFVLGLLGLIFAFIPFVGVVAWPLVILGIIFSGIGFARARKGKATNKGLSIAGLVLSVIGLVVAIIWLAAFGKAVNDTVNNQPKPVTPPSVQNSGSPASQAPPNNAAKHTVVLEATTGVRSNVQWTSGFSVNGQDVIDAGKTWAQTLTMNDLAFTTLSVTPVNAQLGSPPDTCKVTVDGKVAVENSNSVGAICSYTPGG